MPVHYMLRCDRCDHQGPLVSGGYQAVVRESGELVTLPHPGEWQTLAAEGYSLLGAGMRGRYVQVRELLCVDCGKVSEHPSLAYSTHRDR